MFGALVAISCGSPTTENGDSDTTDFSRSQFSGQGLPLKKLSLTFDDGPGSRTLELAEYLQKEGIQATFFVVGKNAAEKGALLQRIKNLGHLIGNHSYSHPKLPKTANPVKEVRDTDNIIAPFVDNANFVFRAPYASWVGSLADILNATSLKKYVGSIIWDVGGVSTSRYKADWSCWDKKLTVAQCGQGYLNEISDKKRGIVLLHDVHGSTVDMTKWLVPKLKAQGYSFIRVDKIPNIAIAIAKAKRNKPAVADAGQNPGQ